MPVEINQLHIKINVDSKEKEEQRSGNSLPKKMKEELVAACVSAVLDVLEQQKKR